MKRNRAKVLALVGILGLLATGALLWADPPDRVGRLNFISGTVSFHPASLDEWAPATPNYPLTTGDHLWTDQDGQAEVHVGSLAIRLAASTDFEFLNLDDSTVQIRLTVGSLNVRVRELGPDNVVEIDTPNSSLTLTRPGSYRVDVRETGDTSLTVRLGEAEVTAGDSSFSVFARQSVVIDGLDSPQYQLAEAPAPDTWDAWCDTRDRQEDRAPSYVPREMVGAEDLGQYGTWTLVAGYGPVWRPREVVPGWAPYHFGHWAWVDPWGWTWIDDAPWGFAPFHYGRWAFLNSAWVWIPGTAVARPVYAPALVAFVGGDGFGATVVAGGGVGWFPLGPREPYVPPYTVSTTYVRNVNYGHVTVVNVQTINVTTVRYVNRAVPGAVVVVPNQAFVRAQPVAGAAFVVPAAEMRAAPVRGWTAPVAPVRESVLAQPFMPARPVARPPAVIMNRPVVGRREPPPPPVPFAARQQALQAHPGRPVDPGTLSTLRGQAPPPRAPVVIVNPAVRAPGGPGAPPGRGPAVAPGPGRPAPVAPGPSAGRPVAPGPQPVTPGQQGPRPVPGMQAPGARPAPTPPGQRPGFQPGQPSPRMQPAVPGGQQPGPRPGQPAPRMRPDEEPGQQPAMQPGAQPGPRGEQGIQRGNRGGPQAGPGGPQAGPGGPQAGPRGNPGGGDDDILKRRPAPGPGPGGQPGAPARRVGPRGN